MRIVVSITSIFSLFWLLLVELWIHSASTEGFVSRRSSFDVINVSTNLPRAIPHKELAELQAIVPRYRELVPPLFLNMVSGCCSYS